MPIVDQHYLNPFEKWLRYGRFPFHFLLHLALLFLVTTEATRYFQKDIRHVSRTMRHFRYLFVGDKYDDRTHAAELHSPKELQIAVDRTVGNHFSINHLSIVNYVLEDPELLYMRARWRDGNTATVVIERSHFMDNTTGGQNYLREEMPFLYSAKDLPRLESLRFQHNFQELGGYHGSCYYLWDLQTSFDGAEAGVFKLQLGGYARDCQTRAWHLAHLFNITIVSLSVISLGLLCRKLWRNWVTIGRLRASPQAWSTLTCGDVASLFSPWWGIMLVMHLAQLRASSVCMQPEPEIGKRFACIGVSCFLTWLNICQYFESFPGFYYAFHTLYQSAWGVLRFITSVVPVFLAFALLGVCMFWQSPLFATPENAFCALFSLMNGDMLHDTFMEVYSVAGFLGHLYIYMFLFLFIFVILNTNLSIVTDAYEKTKSHPQRESLRAQRQIARAASGQLRSGASSPREARSPELRAAPDPAPPRAAASPASCQPQRSMSRRASGSGVPELAYMNPRYFDANKRMVQAMATVFPERPQPWSPRQHGSGAADGLDLLRPQPQGALDSPLMTAGGTTATSFTSGDDPFGAPALELTARGRPAEDFDAWLQTLQDATRGLQDSASELGSDLLPVLARLQLAVTDVVDAARGRGRAVQQLPELLLPPPPRAAH